MIFYSVWRCKEHVSLHFKRSHHWKLSCKSRLFHADILQGTTLSTCWRAPLLSPTNGTSIFSTVSWVGIDWWFDHGDLAMVQALSQLTWKYVKNIFHTVLDTGKIITMAMARSNIGFPQWNPSRRLKFPLNQFWWKLQLMGETDYKTNTVKWQVPTVDDDKMLMVPLLYFVTQIH